MICYYLNEQLQGQKVKVYHVPKSHFTNSLVVYSHFKTQFRLKLLILPTNSQFNYYVF